MFAAHGLNAIDVNILPKIEVGPGCFRRDLPSRMGVRIWVVDMDPGAEWPHVDQHDLRGEDIFVAEGVVIEGGQRFGAGSFLFFDPNSSHRPRSDSGARLFGFNLI